MSIAAHRYRVHLEAGGQPHRVAGRMAAVIELLEIDVACTSPGRAVKQRPVRCPLGAHVQVGFIGETDWRPATRRYDPYGARRNVPDHGPRNEHLIAIDVGDETVPR